MGPWPRVSLIAKAFWKKQWTHLSDPEAAIEAKAAIARTLWGGVSRREERERGLQGHAQCRQRRRGQVGRRLRRNRRRPPRRRSNLHAYLHAPETWPGQRPIPLAADVFVGREGDHEVDDPLVMDAERLLRADTKECVRLEREWEGDCVRCDWPSHASGRSPTTNSERSSRFDGVGSRLEIRPIQGYPLREDLYAGNPQVVGGCPEDVVVTGN